MLRDYLHILVCDVSRIFLVSWELESSDVCIKSYQISNRILAASKNSFHHNKEQSPVSDWYGVCPNQGKL